MEIEDGFAGLIFVKVVVESKPKVEVFDPDEVLDSTVKVPLPTEVALPNALTNGKPLPPNPPPPNPPPPDGLPENPPERTQPADVGREIDTVRASVGPEEPEVPSTSTQSPATRSDPLAATVSSTVVDDDQSTVTELPVRTFWTTMDDGPTEVTSPEARGRPETGVTGPVREGAEVAPELQAPSASAPTPTAAIPSPREKRGQMACEQSCIDLCSYGADTYRPELDEMISEAPVRML